MPLFPLQSLALKRKHNKAIPTATDGKTAEALNLSNEQVLRTVELWSQDQMKYIGNPVSPLIAVILSPLEESSNHKKP